MYYQFNIIQNSYTICPPGWGMEDECAIFYRMYYIRGGKAYLKKEGKDIRLEKNHFYIFPMMQPYTLWQDIEDPLEVLWFHVEIEGNLQFDFGHIEIKENEELYFLLQSIRCLQQEANCFQDVAQIFDIFLKRVNERFTLHRTNSRRMKRVLAYIGEHLQENPSVYELAMCAGMERSYFARRFKEIFLMSPSHFIYTQKMSVGAKSLLSGSTVK
ncbi:MAG: AraC family transcriptional regulator, partial [Lachnospiraceae bacterium]